MPFDIQLIKALYSRFPKSIASIRKIIKRPLTLTEKILYTHLSIEKEKKRFHQGIRLR